MIVDALYKSSRNVFWAAFIVIAAGAFVRVTGSGLGCPDWPKCFGAWVPPIDATQLPEGFDRLKFNAIQTWTEYLNRLVGAAFGLFVLRLLFISWRHRHVGVLSFGLSLTLFFVTGFQAWLGGQVVAEELRGALVTAHFVFAFLILAVARLLMWLNTNTARGSGSNRMLLVCAVGLMILLLMQVFLGAHVRVHMEPILMEGLIPRQTWVNHLPEEDFWHRKIALLMLLISSAMLYVWRSAYFRGHIILLLVVVMTQSLLGMAMAYLSFNVVAQFLHVPFATGVFVAVLDLIVMSSSLRVKQL